MGEIIHRDLKSQNVWISHDYTAMVGPRDPALEELQPERRRVLVLDHPLRALPLGRAIRQHVGDGDHGGRHRAPRAPGDPGPGARGHLYDRVRLLAARSGEAALVQVARAAHPGFCQQDAGAHVRRTELLPTAADAGARQPAICAAVPAADDTKEMSCQLPAANRAARSSALASASAALL